MSLGHPNVAQYVVTINSYIKKKGRNRIRVECNKRSKSTYSKIRIDKRIRIESPYS